MEIFPVAVWKNTDTYTGRNRVPSAAAAHSACPPDRSRCPSKILSHLCVVTCIISHIYRHRHRYIFILKGSIAMENESKRTPNFTANLGKEGSNSLECRYLSNFLLFCQSIWDWAAASLSLVIKRRLSSS